MRFVDTHCHLDGEEFRDDLEAVVARAREAGVGAIGIPGIDLASCDTVMAMCRRYPGYCYPMLGLHPEEVKADWQTVLAQIKPRLSEPQVVAIGEVGLDFYWSREFEQAQLAAFEEQVKWSVEYRLPLMIHCRKAQHELVAILKRYQNDLPGGVFHCFTGNEQEAKELLDKPGEWYYDFRAGKLYYMTREAERKSPKAFSAVYPVLETLIEVVGTADHPVRNITIKGVAFSHTTWMRPTAKGHVPLQAGMYLTEAYKLRPQIDRKNNHKLDNQGWLGRADAAVEVRFGENVSFEGCRFEHLGGSGLDYVVGCKGGTVSACTFTDIAMNGLVAGSFSPEGLETHLPYQPSDFREVCTGLTVKESEFCDVSNEDWGCVAIAAGYVSGITIEHNSIHDVSYTGISLGWGWNRDLVCMKDNKVHANLIYNYAKHMYDCAGIYTLGNQPGTVISENVVRDIAKPSYVHDPNHWFYLYTDEGSSNITLRDNWTPSEKFLKNANGPGNSWENNGPQVNEDIKLKAGITNL